MAGLGTVVGRVVDTVGYSCKVTTMRIILLVCALLTGAVQANEQALNGLRAEFAQTGALSAASAEKLRELADSGNTPAMLVLANMADAGIGVNANQKWAFDWTLRAARNADPLAQYLLGERYIQRLGTPGDKTPDQLDERALFWMNKAAEQFEPAAMFALGQMLRTGQWRDRGIAGVQVDAAAGLQMVELSAVQDYGPALLAMYRHYHKENAGRFDPDEQRAQRYLQRCAEVGDPECSFELATRLLTGDAQTRNVPRAMELLQVASEAGITKAMVLMQAIAQMGVR